MRTCHIIPFAVFTAGSLAAALPAQADPELAIGGGIGTPGANVEAQIALNDLFGLRGGYNYLAYSTDDTFDDIAYDAELDMQTFGAFLDVRPFSNSFIVTGGAYFGDKKIDAIARPTTSVEIGGTFFTPEQIGELDMTGDIGSTAPFAGIGFDTTFQGDGNIGFKLIAGAMFTDSPAITLTAEGGDICAFEDPVQAAACEADPAAQTAALVVFQAELEQERQNLEDDIEDFKVYPVLQAGLTFRF